MESMKGCIETNWIDDRCHFDITTNAGVRNLISYTMEDLEESNGVFTWEHQKPIHITKLAKIFPEARSYFIKKQKELKKKLTDLNKQKSRVQIDIIPRKKYSEQDKLWTYYIQTIYNPVKDSLEASLAYCEKFLFLTGKAKQSYKGGVTDQQIEFAKQVPIDSMIKFDRAGFATSIWNEADKTPSMKYYPKTNTVKCYSTGEYGDSITIARHLFNLSFVDAVRKLNGSAV